MRKPQIGERWRLKRVADGDDNAHLETNEFDPIDFEAGGDGIVYAGTEDEAKEIRKAIAEKRPYK